MQILILIGVYLTLVVALWIGMHKKLNRNPKDPHKAVRNKLPVHDDYLLFGWVCAHGGADDFIMSYGTIEMAMEAGDNRDMTYQIVEAQTMTVVKRKMSKTDANGQMRLREWY
jgi:hypothetical protein